VNIQEGFKATSAEAEFESECSTYYQYERPEILELIPNHAKRILDIGCAAGWLGEAIKRRQACTVYGIEANPVAAKRAAERIDKVWNAHVEQIIEELDAAFFDCIVLADVLEHLINP